MEAAGGTVRLIDAMPIRGREGGDNADVVRIVEGVAGRVEMRMDLTIRFDYGHLVPCDTRTSGRLGAVAASTPTMATRSSSMART